MLITLQLSSCLWQGPPDLPYKVDPIGIIDGTWSGYWRVLRSSDGSPLEERRWMAAGAIVDMLTHRLLRLRNKSSHPLSTSTHSHKGLSLGLHHWGSTGCEMLATALKTSTSKHSYLNKLRVYVWQHIFILPVTQTRSWSHRDHDLHGLNRFPSQIVSLMWERIGQHSVRESLESCRIVVSRKDQSQGITEWCEIPEIDLWRLINCEVNVSVAEKIK